MTESTGPGPVTLLVDREPEPATGVSASPPAPIDERVDRAVAVENIEPRITTVGQGPSGAPDTVLTPEMFERIFERVVRRLRRELRLEHERKGRWTDAF